MFWDAVLGGLRVLTHWETYAAGLEYVAIVSLPMVLVGALAEMRPGVGCLGMLFVPVLQFAGVIVFILTLAPILLGVGDAAAWSLPWRVVAIAPGAFFKLVGVLLVVTLVLAFIPIVGQLQSLHTMILGGIVLAFFLVMVDIGRGTTLTARVSFIPDLWFSIGLLLVGGALSWVALIVAGVVAVAIDPREKGFGLMLAFPLGTIFGFIPVFIYGAWLGAQVRGLL
jgi:hypothetical protein